MLFYIFSPQPSYFNQESYHNHRRHQHSTATFIVFDEKSLCSPHRMEETSHFSTYIICSAFLPTNLIFLLFLQYLACLHSFFLSLWLLHYTATLKFSSCLSFKATSINSCPVCLLNKRKYISTFLQLYIFLMMMTKATMTLLGTTVVW